MMRDKEKTLSNLIEHASNAFIAYIDSEGFPVTKAMLIPRKREGIKYFYFTTNTPSNKVKNYRINNKASIYFYDKRFYRGVSLVGTVEILEDEESKKMIWLDGDEMYYPRGVNDPDYCVIKFTAFKGSYYAKLNNESFFVE